MGVCAAARLPSGQRGPTARPRLLQDSIRTRLCDVVRKREKHQAQYSGTADDLAAGVAYIEGHLPLFEEPYEV